MCGAARQHGVPENTLKGRVSGKVKLETEIILSASKNGDRNLLIDHHRRGGGHAIIPCIVLYMAGMASHMSAGMLEWGCDNNIILLILPSHTSHMLQPLDITCFGALNNAYNQECQKFLRNNPTNVVHKFNMTELSGCACQKTLSPSNLI